MKTLLALAAVALAAAPARADQTIVKRRQTVTLDCRDDPVIEIAGNANDITVTGRCDRVGVAGNANRVTAVATAAVDVRGNGNTVEVGLVDAIAIPGNKNAVTYRGPFTADRRVGIRNLGRGNRVVRAP